jgi:hypothetical protein
MITLRTSWQLKTAESNEARRFAHVSAVFLSENGRLQELQAKPDRSPLIQPFRTGYTPRSPQSKKEGRLSQLFKNLFEARMNSPFF